MRWHLAGSLGEHAGEGRMGEEPAGVGSDLHQAWALDPSGELVMGYFCPFMTPALPQGRIWTAVLPPGSTRQGLQSLLDKSGPSQFLLGRNVLHPSVPASGLWRCLHASCSVAPQAGPAYFALGLFWVVASSIECRPSSPGCLVRWLLPPRSRVTTDGGRRAGWLCGASFSPHTPSRTGPLALRGWCQPGRFTPVSWTA